MIFSFDTNERYQQVSDTYYHYDDTNVNDVWHC